MVELVTFGETPIRISPPENERIEMARDARLYADGTESNVAVAAHELGTDTLWLSKLPDTAVGRNVVRQIESKGVETSVAWSDNPDRRQGLTFSESVVPPRESYSWYDRENTAAATATPGDFPMQRVQSGQVVFTALSTAVLSEMAAETSEALLRASGGSGAVTALDLDYSTGLASKERYHDVFEEISPEVDVLFAKEKDARMALDRSGGPRELANTLASTYDLQIVVITLEGRGAVALHDTPGTNVIHERNTIDTDTIDPNGQQGVFIGAFLDQLISGADEARSLSYAVAAAALARTLPGPFLTTTGTELEAIVDQVIDKSQ
jgi:2-dehydro-3-deoxygluconokinase